MAVQASHKESPSGSTFPSRDERSPDRRRYEYFLS